MGLTTLPGAPSPAAGFDDPFGVLDACHDRVRRTLALLQRLVEHLREAGADAAARDAARAVLRYFGIAAPAHHEDEERHVVALLRGSGDAESIAAADRLLAGHARIRAGWSRLAPLLEQIAAGAAPDADALAAAAGAFVAEHTEHLALEDGDAFPRAAALARTNGEETLRAMGAEMAARRGVPVEHAQGRAPGAA